MEYLGLKGVYHMAAVGRNPEDAAMWAQALQYKFNGKGKPLTQAEWDSLLGEVQVRAPARSLTQAVNADARAQATMDFPAAACMPELLIAFPDAKVIVCERDVDSWYRSVERTVNAVPFRPWDVLLLLDHELFRPWAPMIAMFPRLYGGNSRDPVRAKAAYRAYYAEVRGLVPEGPRRLEYRLGDGWAPLCRFLGKEVPEDMPFPNINDGRDFLEASAYMKACAWRRVRRKLAWWSWRLAPVAVIGLGLFVYMPKTLSRA